MVRSIDLRGTVEVAKHSGSDFDDLKMRNPLLQMDLND